MDWLDQYRVAGRKVRGKRNVNVSMCMLEAQISPKGYPARDKNYLEGYKNMNDTKIQAKSGLML